MGLVSGLRGTLLQQNFCSLRALVQTYTVFHNYGTPSLLVA